VHHGARPGERCVPADPQAANQSSLQAGSGPA
jgi:hypothetical protein